MLLLVRKDPGSQSTQAEKPSALTPLFPGPHAEASEEPGGQYLCVNMHTMINTTDNAAVFLRDTLVPGSF